MRSRSSTSVATASRGRGLVALKVRDACRGEQLAKRAMVKCKTKRPIQFEITPASSPGSVGRHHCLAVFQPDEMDA